MWLRNWQGSINSVMRLVHTVNIFFNTVTEIVPYKHESGQEEILVTSADDFYTAGIWLHRTVICTGIENFSLN